MAIQSHSVCLRCLFWTTSLSNTITSIVILVWFVITYTSLQFKKSVDYMNWIRIPTSSSSFGVNIMGTSEMNSTFRKTWILFNHPWRNKECVWLLRLNSFILNLSYPKENPKTWLNQQKQSASLLSEVWFSCSKGWTNSNIQ